MNGLIVPVYHACQTPCRSCSRAVVVFSDRVYFYFLFYHLFFQPPVRLQLMRVNVTVSNDS